VSDGAARRVAEALDRRGLALPGRLLLDAHRPLAPLLSDLGAALGPLIGVAAGERANDLRGLVEDPDGLDELVDELDRNARGGTRGQPG
jgi:hypothetical protein